ncbi:MAG: DUF433 domain-containing protein [Aggregatilineales bacterium]
MTFKRITIDAAKMNGLPCIRGLLMPIVTVVDMMSGEEILADFPDSESRNL